MKRPIEALRSSDLFESGIGHLVVSRFKADGRVETGFFLIDTFCLGVKDADFCEFSDYAELQENLLAILFRNDAPAPLTPAAARKLAEDAAAYARSLGFSPAADYKKACRVFGGVSTADCQERFVFGKNGKPFYVQGPDEPPAACERILRALEASCGEGGYHFIAAPDDFELDEDELSDELSDEDTEAAEQKYGPYGAIALRAMADRLETEDPSIKVLLNPPGRRKLSDMISQVAEPLLENVPDYETRDKILKMAALAWNLCRLPPPEQKEALGDIGELFPDAEVLAMFALLVARTMSLFPDENRAILKIETEPAPFGEIGLRVASSM